MHRTLLRPCLFLALLAVGWAHAFDWAPFVFPDGDQRYTLEILQGAAGEASPATIDIVVEDLGDTFDVATTMTFTQHGVPADGLQDAFFGGGTIGMFALGPMLLYGPSFMILPMVLDGQDIHVRSEPIVMPGIGEVHMDSQVQMNGHQCVVIRLETGADSGMAMEFALAEGLPLPCYSRYGQGEETIEVRLIRAE